MNWPEQLEYAVADRQEAVRREMYILLMVRSLPRGKPRWQRWMARLLVKGGTLLASWGTTLAEPSCPPVSRTPIAVSLGCAPGIHVRD